MTMPPAIPRATYRLQFHAGFTFHDAAAIVPYLADLGISHVYASPFLKARPGSTHGYDIVDHGAFNPELGGAEGFAAFSRALEGRGMGLLLDFVPNHMAVLKADNVWWRSVLALGRKSPYAHFFDIDWRGEKPSLSGRVMLPVLGGHYGDILVGGEIALVHDSAADAFEVAYFEHRFPLRPEDEAILRAEAGDSDEARAALAATYAGTAGRPGTWRRLHALLQRQHYRLAHWRASADEINYRRFFDVDDLAGLRMEEPDLFAASHRLVASLIADGRLHGLRIDHVDGLHDPGAYLDDLVALATREAPEGAPGLYLLVEKILGAGEALPDSWPVHGTTGYDWLNLAGGLFVDPDAAASLEAAYWSFVRAPMAYGTIAREAKERVIDTMLASGLNMLASELDRMSEGGWRTRDYTRQGLHRALKAVLVALDVYRTYAGKGGASPEDRARVASAVAQARRGWRGPDRDILDFVGAVLAVDPAGAGGIDAERLAAFARRFQQYSGPVMAKSVEDTAFYRHVRLLSLNEVGGDPERMGTPVADFHEDAKVRAQRFPHAMLATSTHDTKRGEDVRMRISVLSEIPDLWATRVRRWQDLNRPKLVLEEGRLAPSRNDEYLLYQTLLGAWPDEIRARRPIDRVVLRAFTERIVAYSLKAAREAKLETSWAAPDAGYEAALERFVRRLLDPDGADGFLDEMAALAGAVAFYGALNVLSLVTLKLAAPGVPDIYQGTELADLSLVDPDNRRPVDYDVRRRLLDDLRGRVPPFAEGGRNGTTKLALIARILQARRALPEVFARGDYLPLDIEGDVARHLLAFSRNGPGGRIVVCVGRLFAARDAFSGGPYGGGWWQGTRIFLPRGDRPWSDLLGGGRIAAGPGGAIDAAPLLDRFPVALLIQRDSDPASE